jgi:1,4-dihydroxy-2-naphthoate octaprenyltransferase
MVANFTGDIAPDKENDAMYKYEMRIYLKYQKGSYYFGLIFLFWGFVFLLVMLYYLFI